MQRDRTVVAALGCTLALLVALIFAAQREAPPSTVGEPRIRTGSAASPHLVATMVARTLRLRPAAPSLSPDNAGRTADHRIGAPGLDALPLVIAAMDPGEFCENASRGIFATRRLRLARAAWHRPAARAPPA